MCNLGGAMPKKVKLDLKSLDVKSFTTSDVRAGAKSIDGTDYNACCTPASADGHASCYNADSGCNRTNCVVDV